MAAKPLTQIVVFSVWNRNPTLQVDKGIRDPRALRRPLQRAGCIVLTLVNTPFEKLEAIVGPDQ